MRISDWSSDVCSSDLKIESPRFYRKCEIAIGRTQTARKSKRARAIHAKVANRRKDYLHKASAKIASQYGTRSEEHTSELQSLMRISYAVFGLKNKAKLVYDEYNMRTVERHSAEI